MIGAVITALVAGVWLWRVEHRVPAPVVPPPLFRIRRFDVANLLTFTIYGGMGVMFFLLPLQLQVTAGWSPLAAGSALLPVTLIMLVLSTAAGTIGARIGPRLPLTVGSIVMGLGMVLMTRIGPNATFLGTVAVPVVVFGLGLTAIVAPVTSAALGSVPDSQAGAASGVNNAVARTGSLLAVAGIPGLAGLTGEALNRPSLLDAGYSTAMFIAAGLVGGSAVLAWFLLAGTDARPTDSVAVCHACPVDGTLSSPLGES